MPLLLPSTNVPLPSKGLCLQKCPSFCNRRAFVLKVNLPLPSKGLCLRMAFVFAKSLCLRRALAFAIEGQIAIDGLGRQSALTFGFEAPMPLLSKGYCLCLRRAFALEWPLPFQSKGLCLQKCLCHRRALESKGL